MRKVKSQDLTPLPCYGLILMTICVVASLTLALTYRVTEPKIIEQKGRLEKESLAAALPGIDAYEAREVDGEKYYEGYRQGKLVGYVLKAEAEGYAGPIEMMVGIDLEGKITGVSILDHQETPGLGARIVEIKYGEAKPWFLRQFEGREVKDLDITKIEAITGATISSQAVVDGLREKIEQFLKNIK